MFARIDPNVRVGDQVKIDGVTYKVGIVEDLGPNVKAQTEYVKMLGLQRPRGKKIFALNITEDGRHGRLVDLGW